jgi:5-methylcytosine-specific restriction endonuclease McrBC regulatory subunit McrC
MQMKMRTTDNNYNGIEIPSDENLANLRKITETVINTDKDSDLLVFPAKWQGGIDRNESICRIIKEEDKYKLTTGNIMGFVGVGDTELTISSRFYPQGNDYFLHYILAKVFSINVVNLDISKGAESIQDFLPYLFPALLNDALTQGLFKQYQRKQYNDANVKGVIDVVRHIRQNIPFAGKIAYNTREHSYDNAVTQLVRHTVEHLRTRNIGHSVLTSNANTRDNVLQIEMATPAYKRNDLQKVIRENLKPVNHPYYTKYKPLQALCLQILRRDKTTFGADKNKIHGLLFDGAWLWEEYINTLIGNNFWHPRNKKTVGEYSLAQRLFAGNEGLIYPDFISKDAANRIIADAKYKPSDNISGNDYLQLLAYIFRFDSKAGYYIYPCDNGTNTHELDLLEGAELKGESVKLRDIKTTITKFGLQIPQAAIDFLDFQERIKLSENELINQFIK